MISRRGLAPALVAFGSASALVGAALAQAPPASPPAAPVDRSRFVRVEGRRFVLEGRRFRFLGANAAVMHGLAHRASVEATLDAVAADGLRVVRVWALGEQPENAEPWARDYAFRVGRGGWVESTFAHLDRVLDAARARGLRVILVLANRWPDYGGVARYLDWAGAAGLSPTASLARFFSDAAAWGLYREHVERVVTRVNARTGVAYRDDPTVLAWDLINESDAPPRDRDALVRWTREAARLVRSLDPAHLVSAGHIGYTGRAQRATWLALQRLPEVDYADAHAYPAQLASVRTLAQLDDFVDDHAQLAHHVAGKPLVWGELGFTTRRPTLGGLPRARWFERFLERSERDDVDGALAWIYTPSDRRPREHGLYVDAPHAARTRDVRAVWSRFAARWSAGDGAEDNPRLGAARGESPLWSTRHRVEGSPAAWAAPSVAAGAVRWALRPELFAAAEAESCGRWDRSTLAHVYASGVAAVTYRLRVTAASARVASGASRVRLRMRASSELPGDTERCGPDEASTVRAFVDDAPLGEVAVPCDDGLGAWVEVVTGDARALAALRAPGVHTLRLEVPEGPRANGLCVYGGATGRFPLPPEVGELPGRLVLSAER